MSFNWANNRIEKLKNDSEHISVKLLKSKEEYVSYLERKIGKICNKQKNSSKQKKIIKDNNIRNGEMRPGQSVEKMLLIVKIKTGKAPQKSVN